MHWADHRKLIKEEREVLQSVPLLAIYIIEVTTIKKWSIGIWDNLLHGGLWALVSSSHVGAHGRMSDVKQLNIGLN
jgi:hypothetical protein